MDQSEHNTTIRDEWRDKLLDRALRETSGGETPPDLSARILSAAQGEPAAAITSGDAEMKAELQVPLVRRRWTLLAVAASLLIAVGAALTPTILRTREAARRTDSQARSTDSGLAALQDNAAHSAPRMNSEGRQGQSRVLSTGDDGDRETVAGVAGKPVAATAERLQSSAATELEMMVTPRNSVMREKTVPLQGAPGSAGAPISPTVESSKAVTTTPSYGAYGGAATAAPATGTAVAPAQQAASSPSSPALGAPFRQGSFGLAPKAKELSDLSSAAEPGEVQLGVRAYAAGDLVLRRQLEAGQADQLAAAAKSDWDAMYQESDGAGDPQGLPSLARPLERGLYFEQLGQGPGRGGDRYARIVENPFRAISAATTANRLSTFSIDVDTASYANVRQFLMQSGALPPPDAVRIEELVNYFAYDYSPPTGDVPFAANVEVAACPWTPAHRLVRVALKGREMDRSQRPQSNLVFLIDVSGSMDEPNKLPLLLDGMRMLARELGENDRVAIAVYASSEGLALASTPGTDQSRILAALDQLRAGGSTAGGAGIQLAYQVAAANFIQGGVNRVILCTDGDFNVGVTSPAELERMAEAQAKETGVFLTVLGFGRGNLNDAMMEQIADKGNGNYHYVDSRNEARKVLVEEMAGTLVTIAKDVKIQVEFNPAKVAGYRLVGYENRMLAAEDFNDDQKDAGEIGAGHAVTALYEVVPAGQEVAAAGVDELKYQPGEPQASAEAARESAAAAGAAEDEPTRFADELLTLKIRYKAPDGDVSAKQEFPVADNGQAFGQATEDFKFASAVASFGMLLRDSQYKGNATYDAVKEIAASSRGKDAHGYRQEFVEMIDRAKQLAGQ